MEINDIKYFKNIKDIYDNWRGKIKLDSGEFCDRIYPLIGLAHQADYLLQHTGDSIMDLLKKLYKLKGIDIRLNNLLSDSKNKDKKTIIEEIKNIIIYIEKDNLDKIIIKGEELEDEQTTSCD